MRRQGEVLGENVSCFIVRVDGSTRAALEQYRDSISSAVGHRVSLAAAMRELLSRAPQLVRRARRRVAAKSTAQLRLPL
jgi:hypothetical protein